MCHFSTINTIKQTTALAHRPTVNDSLKCTEKKIKNKKIKEKYEKDTTREMN